MTSKSAGESLREQTLRFWHISRAYNGTSDSVLQTGAALTHLGKILAAVGPKRRLAGRVVQIRDAIICPPKKSAKTKQGA